MLELQADFLHNLIYVFTLRFCREGKLDGVGCRSLSPDIVPTYLHVGIAPEVISLRRSGFVIRKQPGYDSRIRCEQLPYLRFGHIVEDISPVLTDFLVHMAPQGMVVCTNCGYVLVESSYRELCQDAPRN